MFSISMISLAKALKISKNTNVAVDPATKQLQQTDAFVCQNKANTMEKGCQVRAGKGQRIMNRTLAVVLMAPTCAINAQYP